MPKINRGGSELSSFNELRNKFYQNQGKKIPPETKKYPKEEKNEEEKEKEEKTKIQKVFEILGEKGVSKEQEINGEKYKFNLGSPDEKSLWIYINRQKENGKSLNATFSLFIDKTLSGEDRDFVKIGLTRNKVKKTIIEILESLDINFWVGYEGELVIPGKNEEEKEEKEETLSGKRETPPPDMDRLEFFQNHPDSLFGLYEDKIGISSYRVFVFPNFAVLESPNYSHATFFIDFEPPLNIIDFKGVMDENKKQKINEVLNMNWATKNFGLSRTELRNKGHEAKNHKSKEFFKEWEDKMLEAINKRLDKLKQLEQAKKIA